MSERRISSFVTYDLPPPEVPNTTEFALGRENRSNRIKLLLCRLMPYKIPLFEVRSNDTKGNVEEIGEELRYMLMPRRSVLSGRMV